MDNYIFGHNPTHSLSDTVVAECTNKEELCAYWAAIGECEANKSYMKLKCAPSCQTCGEYYDLAIFIFLRVIASFIDTMFSLVRTEFIDINSRCPPLGDDVRPALLPGELNAMFERIVKTAPGNQTDENYQIEEGMINYTVHVHSRPEPLQGEEISRERDLEQPPWVVTFDNFISEEECKHLIELGYKNKYERSEDVGAVQADGTYDSVQSKGRTSEK